MKTIVKFSALALLLFIVGTSCNRFYKNNDFAEKTKNHKTIAILPFEMVMTGRMPKDLTEENKIKIENAESIAFQRNFSDQVHIVGGRGNRKLTVIVQPVDRTLKILEENGISARDSWHEDPTKIAKLLGVDAVVKCKATKQRYLSGLESIGVEIGTTILNSIFGAPYLGFYARTNDVEVSSNILDGQTGEVLFAGRDEISVDWPRPANEAIEQINRRVCRRFPYVTKK